MLTDGMRSFSKRHVFLAVVLSVAASVAAALVVAGRTSLPAAKVAGNVAPRTVTVTAPRRATPAHRHARRRTAPRRAATPTRRAAPVTPHTMCDPNIRIRTATTTCPFAENTFFAFWAHEMEPALPLIAYSPAAHRSFALDCTTAADPIVCVDSTAAEVTFSHAAVDAYELPQAQRFAAVHHIAADLLPWNGDDGPDAVPTPDDPAPSTQVAPDEGSTPQDEGSQPRALVPDTSSTPPGGEIPNYDEGNGYRVQCTDGTYSHSGGIQGACSHHGGEG
jgi:hypothetical protein